MRGFVLANLQVGEEAEFFARLGDVHEILRVYYLFDEYDYLLEVEGSTPEDVARIVTRSIRRLPGVERTAAFIETNPGAFAPVEREGREIPQAD